jgi:hypothetical protein
MAYFSLKDAINSTNSNGPVWSWGSRDTAGTFFPFTNYSEDRSGATGVGDNQIGWCYRPTSGFGSGVNESYPMLAFQNLTAATAVQPQPFPTFGIFVHPSNLAAIEALSPLNCTGDVVIRFKTPSNAVINQIDSKIQRPTVGCGVDIGYTVKAGSSNLLPRTIIPPTPAPVQNVIGAGTTLTSTDYLQFIVDHGTTGESACDDTALDILIDLTYLQILDPIIPSGLSCSSTTATFTIPYQHYGTLTLFNGSTVVATSTITQEYVNSINGVASFSGLNFLPGVTYTVQASSNNQTSSNLITFTPCPGATGNIVNDTFTTNFNTPVSCNPALNDIQCS